MEIIESHDVEEPSQIVFLSRTPRSSKLWWYPWWWCCKRLNWKTNTVIWSPMMVIDEKYASLSPEATPPALKLSHVVCKWCAGYFVFFSLTQGNSSLKIPLSDWPVGMCVMLINKVDRGGLGYCRQYCLWAGRPELHEKQAERAMGSKQQAVYLHGFCLCFCMSSWPDSPQLWTVSRMCKLDWPSPCHVIFCRGIYHDDRKQS